MPIKINQKSQKLKKFTNVRITEGKIRKGGLNSKPKIPKPPIKPTGLNKTLKNK